MKTLRQLLVVGLMVAMTGSFAAAQTFTGGLRGAVKDANGVIPGVTVQLVNDATGASREAVSNDSGEYSFGAVPPGTYSVKATLTGFKSYENKGIRIATQQFITLDVTLEIGTLQETITVSGAAPLIDTSNASTGSVIDARQLETLPSGGRSAFLFAVTVPTVVASGDSQFNRQQDQTNASLLSMGGGARRGNNYLLDGVAITDLRNRASANPSIEGLEGVAVQVHTYDAETGRTGGGIFNTSTKSGTNEWHGSGFYQGRPKWGSSNNFFAERAGQPKPDTYFHLGGGGFGGPILKNRTFFWFAGEGYGSNTTRNVSARFPTSKELAGDFSASTTGTGALVPIYDPLTGDANGNGRTQFPGNIIPANRLNPVARAIAAYFPKPDQDVSDGSNNFVRNSQLEDRAQLYSIKGDHRFNDKVSLSGFYLYNKTDEPCAHFWGTNAFADTNEYLLARRVHLVAANNTWLPSNNTVVTLRYGLTKFNDSDFLTEPFDPGSLGFNNSFINAIQTKKFPRGDLSEYGDGGTTFGAIDPTDRQWNSWSANGTMSKLLGRHTVKAGGDYRRISYATQSFSASSGLFKFDRLWTSANPNTTVGGNAFASFLLGLPSGDPGNLSRIGQSTPLDVYVNYYGGYLQDDFRVSSKLTLNVGLRLEHEDGLREKNNGFTVAFDRTLNPGGALGAVTVNGQPVRGGLVYAGQNGANDYQGNPKAAKFSPRLGLVYSFDPKTVVRAGYGVYWAPWAYQGASNTNYGQIGYSQDTNLVQGQFQPTVSLTNPFPNGVLAPVGNARGALTGVGSQIEFIDQDKQSPYIQQYSIDINRELPGNMALGFEYAGATGRDLGLGGSNDAILNINQLDPKYMALGAALTEQVPNPFFGLPAGQGKSVGSATIQRRELLRPYPQFGDILMRQNTGGKSQYHAAIVKFEKRITNGWGGRINYTYSRLKDNQFGESNFFSAASTEAQNAYDLEAEYAVGLLDVPHKLVFSPIVELPFGEGKRWATSGVAEKILGNWTLSSIIALESGFPLAPRANTNTTGIFTRTQWVNEGSADPATDGSRSDRLQPGYWLTADGYALAAANTFGTLGRTDTRTRTPHRNNWDFVASKEIKFPGHIRGQIRAEVLNLTNTPKVRGPNTQLGNSAFGQIRDQSGFMRLTQMMFRLSF
ncbi:MAG: TonB-dependent receptor [Acidobacteriota bacterium]